MKMEPGWLTAAAASLGWPLPTRFIDIVTTEDLGALLGHPIRHPREWTRARHEVGYDGPDGVVFAVDVGGAAIMLLLDERGVLGESLWRWDLHTGRRPERLVRTVLELPALLEREADRLLEEDG